MLHDILVYYYCIKYKLMLHLCIYMILISDLPLKIFTTNSRVFRWAEFALDGTLEEQWSVVLQNSETYNGIE